jgi:3-phosphoshikimate 1-carboxyvinyltransferase
MKYVISGPSSPPQDTIYIPSSKSISNRMLIMQALSREPIDLHNLSSSDDTRLMQEALASKGPEKDIGHAGTAMRFLTAFYAVKQQRTLLTGSQRMQERPVGPLVDALTGLGARINYLGKAGYPPLDIRGGLENGGSLQVDGGISSQFISALMMIGPMLKGGLRIHLNGEVVSATYIQMTLELMRTGGILAKYFERDIHIQEGSYRFDSFTVESDWSAASYWYQVAALIPGSRILLPHLEEKSLQGDSVLQELFVPMGVQSEFTDVGLEVRSEGAPLEELYRRDFTGCPDLVQTCAATLCALGIPFHFTGTRTLRVKETDRVAALQAELGKLGYTLQADEKGDWIQWDGNRAQQRGEVLIETYHDHRMAMSFAPLAHVFGEISIHDPMVVTKSYPTYWKDLEKAGFHINS